MSGAAEESSAERPPGGEPGSQGSEREQRFDAQASQGTVAHFSMGCGGQFPMGPCPPGYPGYPMMAPGFNPAEAYGGGAALQYPGYPGYGGYGMYPGMYPMYGGYGMFPPPGGYYPQQAAMGFTGQAPQALAPSSGVPSGGATNVNPQNMMPGDWLCPKCGDHVFARNRACRRCATPKPDGAGCDAGGLGILPDGPGQAGSNQRALPGDWHCPKCKDLQFARNKQCRMCGCPKPETAGFDLRDERGGGGGGGYSRRSRSRSRSRSRRRRSRS